MTTFTEVWNAAFQGIPSDTDAISFGAGTIRNLKRDLQERMIVDHSWLGDGNDGKHARATLQALLSKPSVTGTDGVLYAKQVGTTTELFWEMPDGTEVQLTNQGSVNVANFNGGTITGALVVKGTADFQSTTVFEGGTSGAIVVLANAPGVTPDFSKANNFEVTMTGGNIILQNPLNAVPGQSGTMEFIQDITTLRQVTFGSNYVFSLGIAQQISQTLGARDYLSYYVRRNTQVVCNFLKGF